MLGTDCVVEQGSRILADLVFFLQHLLVLACLVHCLLVFLLLVWLALMHLVHRLLVFLLRKATVAMVPVETAPSLVLEYMAACELDVTNRCYRKWHCKWCWST